MQTYPKHNLYDALGVPRFTADEAELKKGYRRQISKYHTDKESNITALGEKHLGKTHAELVEIAKKLTQSVLEAWDVLKDAGSRADYDRYLQRTAPRPSTPPPPRPAPSSRASMHDAINEIKAAQDRQAPD